MKSRVYLGLKTPPYGGAPLNGVHHPLPPPKERKRKETVNLGILRKRKRIFRITYILKILRKEKLVRNKLFLEYINRLNYKRQTGERMEGQGEVRDRLKFIF